MSASATLSALPLVIAAVTTALPVRCLITTLVLASVGKGLTERRTASVMLGVRNLRTVVQITPRHALFQTVQSPLHHLTKILELQLMECLILT